MNQDMFEDSRERHLPPELFGRIVDSITIVGEQERVERERRTPRVKLSTHVSVLPWDRPEQEISVRIRDMSASGLGILHSARLALDEQLAVRFPAGGENVLALYTVVYWEPLAENLYAVGASFERLLSEAELVQRRGELADDAGQSVGVLTRIGQALGRVRKAAG